MGGSESADTGLKRQRWKAKRRYRVSRGRRRRDVLNKIGR
jgi:hypothetical protein